MRFFLLSAFAVLTACSAKSGDPSALPLPGGPTPQALTCDQFISQLPKTMNVHGYVNVLENPLDSDSTPLRIFYYGHFESGQTPIIFFNGGPGSDSHFSSKALLQHATAFTPATPPIIFIDQRGTGCSSPYPTGNSPEATLRQRFYGSRFIVTDAEAVRRQLIGEKPWKVFGQSYGAFIVHRYVTIAAGGVLAAFAHANVITPDPMERVTNRIFAQHRVLDAYLEKYPDDRARLATLNRELTPDRCFPNRQAKRFRCGLKSIEPMNDTLAFTEYWPGLHSWITALADGDHLNETVMNEYLTKMIFSQPAGNGWATDVVDIFDRNVPLFNRVTCEEIYRRLQTRGEAPETYLLDECQSAMQYQLSQASQTEILRLEDLKSKVGIDELKLDDFTESLRNNPGLAFHLYSGQLDQMVPVENFPDELRTAGSLLKYVNFPLSGHDGFATESRVWSELLAN